MQSHHSGAFLSKLCSTDIDNIRWSEAMSLLKSFLHRVIVLKGKTIKPI